MLSAGLRASCKLPANIRGRKRSKLATVFRNAAWLIAWDEARAAHVYRHHIDMAIRGNGIVFLGTSMMPMQLIAARGVHLAYGYLFIIAFNPHHLEAAQPGINYPWPAGTCAM